jgi:hypothetical protein
MENGKVFVGAAYSPFPFASNCAEKDRATYPHQKPQTVNNVPNRRHYRQGCRARRAVVFAHHGHVYNGVDRGNQSAAKSSRKILKIQCFYFPVQEIHFIQLLLSNKKAG